MARQLVGRENARAPEAAETGDAPERTLARVAESLRGAIGDDGYTALLARAIALTQTEHSVLSDIRRDESLGFSVDRLTADMGAHDTQVVSAAFESLLASIIDVLSGLIGADMVANLLDPDGISLSRLSEDHNDRT